MSVNRAIKEEVIAVQREEIEELQAEIHRLEHLLAASEGKLALLQSGREGLKGDMLTMLNVIRLLAAQLTNGLSGPRKARREARKLLESRGLDPPSTLGSSRIRKSESS